jgi:hypothetical protein
MTKTFTHHDQLIRSLYKETTEAENKSILSRISVEESFAATAYEWLAITELLDDVLESPSLDCENAILAYANSSSRVVLRD